MLCCFQIAPSSGHERSSRATRARAPLAEPRVHGLSPAPPRSSPGKNKVPPARRKRPRRMGPCKRGRRRRGIIWRTTPPLKRYGRGTGLVSRRRPGPKKFEPFGYRPDILLPGTLHHSGNRPAPPSDHIPLVRRSALRTGQTAEHFGFIRIGGHAGNPP